jgi:hypothetical protein
MNVATLQQFLRSLVPALQATDAGARVGQDLERACRALEPFHALDLIAFAGFLERCEEYRQSGNVTPPSELDLGPVQQSLRRFGQVRNRLGSAGDGTAVKEDLVEVQEDLIDALLPLTQATGLQGTLKPMGDKWLKQQLNQMRARAHAEAFRALTAQITEPAAFEREEIRSTMQRLEHEITGDEWKLLATEFSLPKTPKGAKGVMEVLFALTGQRPAKAKAPRKSKAVVVDEAKVASIAEPLKRLLERAKTEAQLPESEVDQQLNSLEGLSKEELIAVATLAGIERPGRTKPDVLNKIKSRLTAGKRVMEQTAH